MANGDYITTDHKQLIFFMYIQKKNIVYVISYLKYTMALQTNIWGTYIYIGVFVCACAGYRLYSDK